MVSLFTIYVISVDNSLLCFGLLMGKYDNSNSNPGLSDAQAHALNNYTAVVKMTPEGLMFV